jgi:hypothetical protein
LARNGRLGSSWGTFVGTLTKALLIFLILREVLAGSAFQQEGLWVSAVTGEGLAPEAQVYPNPWRNQGSPWGAPRKSSSPGPLNSMVWM